MRQATEALAGEAAEYVAAVEAMGDGRQHYMDAMLAVYCRRTDCDPVEVALQVTDLADGTTLFRYKRVIEDDDGCLVAVTEPTWWRAALERWFRRRTQRGIYDLD